jgi:hypothetical protein
MSLKLNSSGGGSVTLQEPVTASNVTLNLPATAGTVVAADGSGNVSVTSLTVNSNNISAVNSLGFRNRIINGNMVIDQRNAGASGTAIAYTVDRWGYYGSQASKGTWQQNAGAVTPPTGYTNYLGFTSSSAYSVLTTDQFYLYQRIEGFNTADLNFGSASATSVTLSFWVRSSLTGTFGGFLTNSAANRTYPFSYTISAANIWEQKTVTVAGDTTGTWLTNNGIGIGVGFNLGTGATYSATANAWTGTSFVTAPTGATSVVGTNGATFYITGVQLEAGSVATPFEQIDYGRELLMCQRYFYRQTGDGSTTNFYSLACEGTFVGAGTGGNFPSVMRTVPSVTLGSGVYIFFPGIGAPTPSITNNRCSSSTAALNLTWSGTGATVGHAGSLYNGTGVNGFINYSAEL